MMIGRSIALAAIVFAAGLAAGLAVGAAKAEITAPAESTLTAPEAPRVVSRQKRSKVRRMARRTQHPTLRLTRVIMPMAPVSIFSRPYRVIGL